MACDRSFLNFEKTKKLLYNACTLPSRYLDQKVLGEGERAQWLLQSRIPEESLFDFTGEVYQSRFRIWICPVMRNQTWKAISSFFLHPYVVPYCPIDLTGSVPIHSMLRIRNKSFGSAWGWGAEFSRLSTLMPPPPLHTANLPPHHTHTQV